MNRNVSSDDSKKPEMIIDYNQTKGGVDVADQMLETYSCQRKTNRWPLKFFEYMIDVSALNGFVVYSAIDPGWNNGNYISACFT